MVVSGTTVNDALLSVHAFKLVLIVVRFVHSTDSNVALT